MDATVVSKKDNKIFIKLFVKFQYNHIQWRLKKTGADGYTRGSSRCCSSVNIQNFWKWLYRDILQTTYYKDGKYAKKFDFFDAVK